MAEIGDVLIKFVANFAEFTKNMEDGQQQLVKFGEQAASTGSKLEGFIGLAKNLLGGLAIGAVVQQITAYADKVQQSAVKTADLARAVNLTTSEVQGLQALADKTGDSFSELAKKGIANRDWLAQVTADAERAGQVMDSSVVQTLKRIQVESDEAARRLQVFFSPAIAATKSWLADQFERIANDLKTIGAQQGIIDKIIALAQMLGYGSGAGASGQFRIDSLTDQVTRREQALADLERRAAQGPSPREIGLGVQGVSPAQVAEARKDLDDARVLLGQAKDAAARAAYGTTTLDPKSLPDPAKTTTGGGGKTDADNIEAQIRRYDALGRNAKEAYDKITGSHAEFVDDLRREITVQQQVADIVEKLRAKNQNVSDEQIKRLTAVVELNQQQRDQNAQLFQDAQRAEQIELKLGDGTRAREKAERDLARAQAASRGTLSPEARARQQKQEGEQIDAAANSAARYDDNLGSLAAGFANAGNASARAHDLFSTGSQVFEGLMGSMGEAIDALVGVSNKGFGEIARDFALMLSKMAAQAALSQIFKYVIDLAKIGASAASASGASAGFTTGDAVVNLIPPGRAAGGPVSPGSPYIVGERGPEFFVPHAAGSIVPMGQMGGGGVTVNVDMGQTVGASNPSQALDFGRKVRAAVVAVIQNEKRPGGTLQNA
jgi:phage-related minor tail protein